MAWTLLIFYCLAIFAAALLGGWLPRRLAMTHTRTQMVMSLVSGLMLGVACYHLVPHSVAAGSDIDFTMQWLMAGMVFMLLMLRLFHFHQHDFGIDAHACSDGDSNHHHHSTAHDHAHPPEGRATLSGLGLLLGLLIHTLVDGVALGAVMRAAGVTGGILGLGVFLAILLHKPLDSLSIEAMMQRAQWPESIRQIVNVGFALVCPLAALAFFAWVPDIAGHSMLLASALAFSAGAFVCIALGDLLPEVHFHSHDRLPLTAMFLLGVGAAFAIGWLEPSHF
jgi:zinc and cadmium transporter